MSSPYESADLLMKLYDLRREPAMREARAWFAADFNPATFEEVQQALRGPMSPQFRMVTSYWDMAASFVNNGAIDEQMFNDANAEQFVVFAKVEPFVTAYRAAAGAAPFVPQTEAPLARALAVLEVEKAAYEIVYEANNRPDWVAIPVRGLLTATAALRSGRAAGAA